MTMNVSCPACGGAAEAVKKPRDVAIGRWSAIVDDESYQCLVCGQEFYLPGQVNATLRKAARIVRERRGLISPEQIRSLRERYAITQDQLEKLLGLGPKSVVRWEGGSVLPTQATSTLLKLLSKHPAVMASLAADRGVSLGSTPPPAPRLRLVEVRGAAARGTFVVVPSDEPKGAVA